MPGFGKLPANGMVTLKWRCSKVLTKFSLKSCFQVDAKDKGTVNQVSTIKYLRVGEQGVQPEGQKC